MRLSVGAEIIKLTRQRAGLFWGFLFIPLFTAFVTLALVGGAPPPLAETDATSTIQPFHSAARALNVGGNPIAQLFYAIGAAAIFAVEYRHSGWRHIVPRASRWTLIVSKFATFALFAALSLALVVLGDVLVTAAVPAMRGSSPPMVDINATGAGIVVSSFLISLLELTVLAGLVALVTVATRSATGAIIAPFLVSLAATMLESYLAGLGGGLIPLPTFAGDALRQWLTEGAGARDAARAGLFGLATLLGWAGVSFCATIALFSRQDLVSE